MPQVQWKSAPPRQAAGVADLLPDATVADLRRVVAEWFALPRAAVRVGLRGGKELSDDAEPPHRVVVWVRPHAEAICAAAVAAGLAACAAAASQPEAAGAAEPAPAAAAASQGAAPAAAAAPRAATRSIAEAIAEVDPAWQLPQVRAALDIAGGDPGGAVDLLLKCGALPSLPPLTQLLAHVPAFEEIRNTIFSNPAMGRQLIEGALDMVRTSHPALFELICRSNAEFFDLLTHGVSAVVGRAAVDPPPDGGQVSSAPPGFTVKLHGVADRVVSAVTLTLPPTAADLNQAAVREFEKPRVVWKGKELPASPTSLLELGFSDGATVFVTGKRRPLSVRRLASSGGPDLTVPYKSSSTVGQLKDSVAALSGIPAWEQRLVHGGRLLADDRKLLPDAGIAAGALLHLAPPPSVAAAAEAAAGEPSEEPSCPTSLGLRGLANLGNTCYMNAGLQCLAATEPLREHFAELRGRTITSRHGMRGALAAEFRRVLTALTASTEGAARPSSHPVSPARFKAVVGQWNSTFVGSGQHDAHELLRFVLDGLHGDLQRVQGPRPYTELRDLDGEGDDEAARRWWAAHAAREDSVIQDIFAGQLLSAAQRGCSRQARPFGGIQGGPAAAGAHSGRRCLPGGVFGVPLPPPRVRPSAGPLHIHSRRGRGGGAECDGVSAALRRPRAPGGGRSSALPTLRAKATLRAPHPHQPPAPRAGGAFEALRAGRAAAAQAAQPCARAAARRAGLGVHRRGPGRRPHLLRAVRAHTPPRKHIGGPLHSPCAQEGLPLVLVQR
eukprot:TRINITY_DN27270_c0_g1_i1.p1 TRINITY_DN27270_c0_g1~~TRINITY_DN27270_c0_g1_i1.p1  ORF type:complete len:782 (+),score=117.51 TRINITY_DN27270_c0_g1_i1:62-2407(+)